MNVKVNFNGNNLWWLKNKDGSGALALLEHCDENGGVIDPFNISFAHVFAGGEIKRFGVEIGTRDDLKIGWEDAK